jgi:hypothetical protein
MYGERRTLCQGKMADKEALLRLPREYWAFCRIFESWFCIIRVVMRTCCCDLMVAGGCIW